MGVPDHFVEHGSIEELQQICKTDSGSLIKKLSLFITEKKP
jgi:hypothetical protein